MEKNLGGDFLMAVKVIFSFEKMAKTQGESYPTKQKGVGLCIRNMDIPYIIIPYEPLNPPK